MSGAVRVLHIAPGIDGGGVGAVICNTLAHMNRDGICAQLAVQRIGRRPFLLERFEAMGVPVHEVARRRGSVRAHFADIRGIMADGRFDIVHCHDQNWAALYLAMARQLGVPVRIAHSHLSAQRTDRARVALSGLLAPMLRRVATGCFACGRAAGAYMWGEAVAASDRLFVLRNAVDVRRFAFDPARRRACRAQLGLLGRTAIGHVGRFSAQKNHAFLLRVFAAYLRRDPDAVLLLAGAGELEGRVREAVRAAGMQGSVILLGQRRDVPALYDAMDAFVLPSLYEGLPLAGVEAQTSGLPCLFSDAIDREAAVLPGVRWLRLTDGPQAWAHALEEAVRGGEGARQGAAAAMARAGYDIAAEAERLRRYYVRAAAQGERR